MTRDKLADADFFTRMVSRGDRFVAECLDEVEAEILERGVDASFTGDAIVTDQLDMAKAAYSRGDPIEAVQARVEKAFVDLKYIQSLYADHEKYMRGWDSYLSKIIRMSYAISFCVGPEAKAALLRDIDFFGTGGDPVLDAMLAYLKGEEIRTLRDKADLSYPKDYTLLWEAIELGAQGGEIPVRKYLETWYAVNAKDPGASGAYGIGGHEKMIRFLGYWCFEVAALVIMLDLDDSSFQDHEHYPFDLVAWARS